MENDLAEYDPPDPKEKIRRKREEKREELKVFRQKVTETKQCRKPENGARMNQIELLNGETPLLMTIYNYPHLPSLIRERWNVWMYVFKEILAEHPQDEMLALQFIEERIQRVTRASQESFREYLHECGVGPDGKLWRRVRSQKKRRTP